MRTESPQAVETGQAHVTLGDHLRRAADPAGAAALYAVAADSEAMPSALRYRAGVSQGWALSEARQYEAAAQAFSKASRNGKDKAETFTALGLAGDAAARGGNYNGAALFYQNVADNDVGSVLGEAARLKQAQARVNAKLYSDAALVYRQFIEEYPNSPQRPKATLERALALRDGGDFRQALAEAGQFVKDYPADAEAPRALMAACAAAKAAGDPAAAIVALTQLIDGYAGSDLYPHALYERTHLGFLQRNTAAALADAERFLAQYAQLPLAADIHMWLGDHYAALGEPVTAESHYLEAANAHPTLPLAQTALYEAAASAFRRDDRERAKKLLVQLGNDYAANPAARVHARAQLLFGDILAREGSYAEAIEHFTRGGTLSDATDLALAAKGRTGDMHYSLGAAGGEDAAKAAEHLRKALDVFTSLAAAPNASREMRDSARYRAATQEALDMLRWIRQFAAAITD